MALFIYAAAIIDSPVAMSGMNPMKSQSNLFKILLYFCPFPPSLLPSSSSIVQFNSINQSAW